MSLYSEAAFRRSAVTRIFNVFLMLHLLSLVAIIALTLSAGAAELGPSSTPGSLEQRQEAKATSDLPVGLDYSVMLQGTRGAAQQEAAGGVARFYGQFDVTPDSAAGSDQLVFKIEHRHRLGTTLAPQDLGFASGYLGLSSLTYSDAGALLTNLFWQHKSADNRWALVAGIVDVTDYVDVYALVNPWRDFSNLAFSTNPTIPAPDQGFGVAGLVLIGSHGYLLAGFADSNADPSDPFRSLADFFSEPELFKHIEFGFVGSYDQRFTNNIHLTLWHADARRAAGVPSGQGGAISGSWQLFESFIPFVRLGAAEGGGALYDRSASVGFGYVTGRDDDVIGFGANWSRPNENIYGKDINTQFTMEAYWRTKFANWLEITTDIQYVDNPALDPGKNSLWTFGARFRAAF